MAARGQRRSACENWGSMSVYEERKDELERYEFMMGRERGRLAVTLDCITDAMVLVGQHGVYCQSVRQLGKPAMDIQLITKSLADAKELVSSVLEEMKSSKLSD
jgi:hypothetical protein